jgi:fructose-bisphosphate aldolase class II
VTLAFNVITIEHAAALSVHLDHFQDVALLTEAIELAAEIGVTSVMVDAAHLPYRENVERTRAFTDHAHAAIHNVLSADAALTDPGKYLAAGRHDIGDTVAELCRAVASVRDRELR